MQSQGFKVFNFDLHIPYYVLKQSKELLRDSRNLNGESLRQSWELPFLSGLTRPMSISPSTEGVQCLYEAQISVIVTGIDQRVWTAYGFFETHFGSKENVEAYHQNFRQSECYGLQ
jgi:hypothetical protein